MANIEEEQSPTSCAPEEIAGANDKWKQVIIVRRDLGMSPGKLAAQVSHASMSFLTCALQASAELVGDDKVKCSIEFDRDMWDGWLGGLFTKVCLGAKTKTKLDNAIKRAEALGMEEGRDFFVIRDHCLTELEPEEIDKNGEGWTVTCVGFRPMPSSEIDPITKKFQLLH